MVDEATLLVHLLPLFSALVPVSVLTFVPKMLNVQLKIIQKVNCVLFLKYMYVSDEVID